MKVPFFDLGRVHQSRHQAYQEVFEQVLQSAQFIRGPRVASFEAQFANYVGSRHAIGVSSGTDALLVSLMAHEIGPGDEVIVPDLTFFAPAGCVARLGATPVFVDIDPETFQLDVSYLEEALSAATKAIVVVHLFGQCAIIEDVMKFAEEHGLAVIEDCAQAIGSMRNGRHAGTSGRAGCFSFFPTKNLGAFGDGGMVVTDDDQLAEDIRCLANHGAAPKYHHSKIGGNFRLDALQAGLLSVGLKFLDQDNDLRRANAAVYERLLGDRFRTPVVSPGNVHTYHQYVLRLDERDVVKSKLHQAGVDTMVYYPSSLSAQEVWKEHPSRSVGEGTAALACAEVLALPIYPGLREDEQDTVVTALLNA